MMRKMIVLCLCLLLVGTLRAQEEPDNLIIAWLGDGSTPANILERGNIVLMDGQGEVIRTLVKVNASDTTVNTCSEQPISPDGIHHALYVGGNTTGNLYIIQPDAEATAIPNTHPYACLGMGSFVWQKDSQSFAYINYNNTENLPYGQLNIRPTADVSQTLYTLENIASFDYQPDSLSAIEVYRDTIRIQHGTLESGLQEVGRIFSPSETCPFRAGHIEQINADTLSVLTGYRCSNNINRWNFYLIDIPSRTTSLLLNTQTGFENNGNAAFTAQASVSHLISSDDGRGVYLTYPDGVLGNFSASIRPIEINRPLRNIADSLHSLMIMPRQPISNSSAIPARSSDGRYIAITQQTADVISTQFIYDLTTFNAIASYRIGSRGDIISSSAFTPDSQSLYMVAGGINGDANTIIKLDIQAGTTHEITRGNFLAPLALSPDGEHALILQQKVGGVNNLPYVDLQRVNLANGQSEVVFVGSDLGDDGRFTRRQFAVPLFWLKAS